MKRIHIVNVATGNGGDLLMAMTAARKLCERLGPRQIVLNGRRVPDVDGLRVTGAQRPPRPLRWIGKLRRKLDRVNAIGRIRPGELVLDANGYRHGGIWPASNIDADLVLAAAIRKRGAHLVLLPKSYGPFDAVTGARFAELVAATNLAWARDRESLRLCQPHTIRLQLCPDFTIGMTAPGKPAAGAARRGILIVPNSKLVERGLVADFDSYAGFLAECRTQLATLGHECRVLFHQDKDYRELHHRLARLGVPWLFDADPRACKAELARAWLVLSSRYHGMIGALSSGTPCLVLGWAHKYAGFLDYYPGGQDLLIAQATLAAVAERAAWIGSPDVHAAVCQRLAQGNGVIVAQTEAMWDQIAKLESAPTG